MIPANELRKGNWFNTFLNDKFKAEELRRDFVMGISENGFCNTSYSEIEPIQITPEILEKAGFDKKVDEGGPFYENSNGHRIYVFKDGFEFEYTLPSGRFNLWRKRNGLHQLQNLYFALTGQELEIKNPV